MQLVSFDNNRNTPVHERPRNSLGNISTNTTKDKKSKPSSGAGIWPNRATSDGQTTVYGLSLFIEECQAV